MQYFSMVVADAERWHLDLVSEEPPIDIWAGSPPGPCPEIQLRIFQAGKRVDFEKTSFAIPVLSESMAHIVQHFAAKEIELMPARVAGDDGAWFVLNTLCSIDCIDYERSWMTYYPRNHPDKPGKLSGVVKLMLDPCRIDGRHVFRPRGWENALIVSQPLKEALEAAHMTGVEFQAVT